MYVSEISTRLSRGMSTPAILAIFSSNFLSKRECLRGTRRSCLTLPLFMLWIFTTDNHYDTIATDYLAVFTTWFYRCTYFHDMPSLCYRYNFFQSQMRSCFICDLDQDLTRHVIRPRVRS